MPIFWAKSTRQKKHVPLCQDLYDHVIKQPGMTWIVARSLSHSICSSSHLVTTVCVSNFFVQVLIGRQWLVSCIPTRGLFFTRVYDALHVFMHRSILFLSCNDNATYFGLHEQVMFATFITTSIVTMVGKYLKKYRPNTALLYTCKIGLQILLVHVLVNTQYLKHTPLNVRAHYNYVVITMGVI